MEKHTRSLTLAALVAAAALLLGCPQSGASNAAEKTETKVPTATDIQTAKQLDAPLRDFGVALFRQQVKAVPEGNVFLSPVSLSQALAMTMNGAGGETRAAMAKTLGLGGMTTEQANAASAALSRAVTGESEGVTVNIANALWGRSGLRFDPEFVRRVEQGYSATVETPMAAPAINAWVNRATRGKITEIVSAADVADADAVLTNAVYFKGRWTVPFRKAATKDGPFTRAPGDTKTVPMMHQTARFGYTEGAGWRAVRIGCGPAPKRGETPPMSARALAVYFLLPNAGVSVNDLADQLDAAAWDKAARQSETRPINLTLPRFKAEYGASLVQPLSALGMSSAFGSDADFGPMGLKGSFIGDVLHKAVLEVNEEGAEAAAATAVVMTRAAVAPPPVQLVFDRPFLVAIRDDATGALLFLGAIRDPQAL